MSVGQTETATSSTRIQQLQKAITFWSRVGRHADRVLDRHRSVTVNSCEVLVCLERHPHPIDGRPDSQNPLHIKLYESLGGVPAQVRGLCRSSAVPAMVVLAHGNSFVSISMPPCSRDCRAMSDGLTDWSPEDPPLERHGAFLHDEPTQGGNRESGRRRQDKEQERM